MTANAPVKQRRYPPQRTCVSCRRELDKRDLLRIVRTPDGNVALDAIGKISGRGAYLCTELGCWDKALRSQRLDRALKCTLSPESRDELRRHAAAMKAGAA